VHLDRLVGQVAPELVALPEIGTDNAATLLMVALKTIPRGSEERGLLRQPLCGVAPMEASSGKVVSHPLNRGGNREANHAL
jgi:transposase